MRTTLLRLSVVALLSGCQTPGEIIPDDMWCGSPDGKHHEWTREVSQRPLTGEPGYLWRAGESHVVRMSQTAVRAKLALLVPEVDGPHVDPEMREFLQSVRSAPKLTSWQDLYAFTLPDGALWGDITHVVVDLVLDGEATIVDTDGYPVSDVVALRSKGPGSSSTRIHVGGTKGERILLRWECIAD